MHWRTYVRRTTRADISQRVIAERTGVDQTTISRWLSGETRSLTPAMVTKFARGYDRPVLEAFVAAGLLSRRDAEVEVIEPPHTLDDFTVDELLAELTERTSKKTGDAS